MRRLGIGLIGAGFRGTQHLQTLVKLEDAFELVAVAEHDEMKADAAQRDFGVPVYAHPENRLDQSDLDVIDIVVPPDGRLALTALAASRGVHVLVETPIAPTVARADAMIDVCNRARVQIEVAENVWRFPNELLEKKAIDRHLLGEVINMQLFYRSGSYHGMSVLRGHFGDDPVRVTGCARALRHRSDFDANSIVNAVIPSNFWEVGVFDFPGRATAVYQFPARSERGNFWEIIGADASFVGGDFIPNGDDARAVPIEPEMNGKTIVALSLDVGSGVRRESR